MKEDHGLTEEEKQKLRNALPQNNEPGVSAELYNLLEIVGDIIIMMLT